MKDFMSDLESYRNLEIETLRKLNLRDVNAVLNVLEKARIANKRIFICGNGGSAATASHYACDFNKGVNMGVLDIDGHGGNSEIVLQRFSSPNHTLYDFECLSDNIPTMMAVSNDLSYNEVFRFPLSIKMKQGDVIIGISGSGNSKNVVNAFEYAKENGGITVAIVGYDGGKLKEMADFCIHVDINDMQISEDIHMVLDHMMMWVLTKRLKNVI